MRRIKDYKNMSKERLLSALDEPELAESENNFGNARIEKIREDFNELRHWFSKPEIKEIRKNLYEIENKKYLSKSRTNETRKNLNELEKNISSVKKYRHQDDIENRGIRGIRNLLDQSSEGDYYKPRITIPGFDNKNKIIKIYYLKNTLI